MRVDARHNRERLLAVAGEAFADGGVEVSLRDVARRADVGLATLLRHFPTREALLDALLRAGFDDLTASALRDAAALSPADALVEWLREFVAYTHAYRGVIATMMRAVEDPDSALHAACVTMRASGSRLLERAQADGVARTDLDGTDLFALAGSVAWLGDQPGLAARVDHLFAVIVGAVMTDPRDPAAGATA